jgi:hydroxyacylglutathione hydrolase
MLECIAIPALSDNYIWLVVNPNNRYAVIIDPGEAAPVLNVLKKESIQPCAILITHHHRDHVLGIAEIQQVYPIPVYTAHNSPLTTSYQYRVRQGEHLRFPEYSDTFHVLETPGHTHDHLAFYTDECLFPGDTLFLGGCGRIFEGTPQQMLHSLDQLANLNENLMIYCAHEYTLANLIFAQSIEPNNSLLNQRITAIKKKRSANQITVPESLRIEKQTNPFLRVHDIAFRQQCAIQWQREFADSIDLFTTIRSAKDNFQFSEAVYLKTGS